MSDKELELQDEQTDQDAQDEQDVEFLKAELAKYKSMADRRKAKLEELGDKSEDESPKSSNDISTLSRTVEELQLKQDGYTKAQVEFLMDNGGLKALEKDSVKKAIEAIKSQETLENAADVSSNSGENVLKVAGADMSSMSAAEMREAIMKNGS